jgi:predicted nucleic acid-binding protein
VKVVFDAGVVFSGAGWRGEAYRSLVAIARRRLTAFATEETVQERVKLVAEQGHRGTHSPSRIIEWYLQKVKRVEPAPLGRRRCRDINDDPYLACALAAGAKIIVSRDENLLVLGKPFGIEIITPRQMLSKVAS